MAKVKVYKCTRRAFCDFDRTLIVDQDSEEAQMLLCSAGMTMTGEQLASFKDKDIEKFFEIQNPQPEPPAESKSPSQKAAEEKARQQEGSKASVTLKKGGKNK